MAKRKAKEQTSHDRKVGRLATEYEKAGYTVAASTGRRPDPKSIGRSKMIPDIVATKHGRTKIIEVETPRSLKTDKAQLETFARYAAKRKNVSFDIVVTKPRGKSSRTVESAASKAGKKK